MKAYIPAIALTFASVYAFAQEVTHFPDAPSTRTRAEVRAEVLDAIARGERLSYGEGGPQDLQHRPATKLTRAEVRDQVIAALERGERLSYGEAGRIR